MRQRAPASALYQLSSTIWEQPMFSPWEEKKADFLRLNAEIEARKGWEALRQHYQRLGYGNHYNPNQPRVPAGHPDGGQWTSVGGAGSSYPAVAGGHRRFAASTSGETLSDASPYPLKVWSQYAESTADRAQDPEIERTRQILHDVLVSVNASVAAAARRNPMTARLYGVIVHAEFARAVRAMNLPGIGIEGVEQSFDAQGLATYGLDGSIRTDIVLRNSEGIIIAIYDVKTGNATMSSPREAKIRAYTRAGRDVPVIIMHAVKGSVWR
jgi:hypothetical protein